MSVEITIQRSPHDSEHPFVMVSRDLINNISISNDLKMLIIYCLSKPKEWVFRFLDIMKHMRFSESTLYRILEEGLQNGYIEKTQQRFNGKFKSVHYFFSEDAKFKKCSPCVKNRDAVSDAIYSNKDSSKNYEFEEPKAEIRKDIAKLSFGDRDKRILSKYPPEAITYANRCISRMPRKPDSVIKVFMSLCESYLTNPKLSDDKQKKKTPEDLARADLNKKIFMSERLAALRRIFSLEPERIVATIDGTEYAISLYCDLFEEQIKITIGSINDQINRSS